MSKRNAKKGLANPSLDLLRGFEAAARHLSFTKAGEELFITQSAVSRQIQALEERLGVHLFQRRHRSLLLTEEGQVLYRATAEALERLRRALEQVTEAGGAKQVSVTTTAGFASLWLIPRLAGFRAACPGVDVRISATNAVLNLERERIDVAIRYFSPERIDPDAVKLFGEEVSPVCSPRLLKDRSRPLAVPADLRHHVLIHFEDPKAFRWPVVWQAWLEAEGVGDIEPAGVLHFSQYDQVIQAAVEGQGVALGRFPLMRRMIREGKLVAPFSRVASPARGYFVVRSKHAGGRPEVQAFIDWLVAEAEKDGAPDPAQRGRVARKRRR
ncbi:MAG: transcriptional regulator GcvA [Betaproteobacteria bacterium]|nr:transcriptional regulator GcvA [Betaproteobacteria bacterium]